MPPIGGQGMNTGFADAWLLIRLLSRIIRDRVPHDPLLRHYSNSRAAAAIEATKRAHLSMRIGTLTGHLSSLIRNSLIFLALHSPAVRWFPRRFAMQTIPFGTIEKMNAIPLE